jgi:hypothetical protein
VAETAEETIEEVLDGTDVICDVGDWVFVVFWRPTPMPDDKKAGVWDTLHGRVVSVGANGVVCYETASRCLDDESSTGSGLRFTRLSDAFLTLDAATEAANKRPKKS